MTLIQMVLLALIQGITEFLPVSSSAHLILLPYVMKVPDQGPLIDLMAHAGSLLAVMAYFRRDVWLMLAGSVDFVTGKRETTAGRLFLLILVATPPALITGAALFYFGLASALRQPVIIGVASLVFALPLWLADRYGKNEGSVEGKGVGAAFVIGLAQILAFIPGTSRSGITMTMARALGVERSQAARFSMLLSIPVLAAMGMAAGLELATHPAHGDGDLANGLIVLSLSALTAYLSIAIFMRLVERIGFFPFALYRMGLGAVLLALTLG